MQRLGLPHFEKKKLRAHILPAIIQQINWKIHGLGYQVIVREIGSPMIRVTT
jgi:hypothetical protein